MKYVGGILGGFGLLSSTALAHEGHGVPGTGQSLLHYLVQPVHALPFWLLLGVALACAALDARRERGG